MARYGALAELVEVAPKAVKSRLSQVLNPRPRVKAAQLGRVHVEQVGIGPKSSGRVAVVAHWGLGDLLSRSVCELLAQLREHDYRVVLVSTSVATGRLSGPDGVLAGVTILRRPNIGYDFGSWATAFEELPWIREASDVLLWNDSMAGPFAAISDLLADFEQSPVDVWGVTDSSQHRYHLQTYAFGFRGGSLADHAAQRFWADVRVERRKVDVIRRYELGLTDLRRAGMLFRAAVPWTRVVRAGQNPTILGWRKLLDLGVPFIKRELLRAPHVTPDASDIPAELARRYGVHLETWT